MELNPSGGNGTYNVMYISPELNEATRRSGLISNGAVCDSWAGRAPVRQSGLPRKVRIQGPQGPRLPWPVRRRLLTAPRAPPSHVSRSFPILTTSVFYSGLNLRATSERKSSVNLPPGAQKLTLSCGNTLLRAYCVQGRCSGCHTESSQPPMEDHHRRSANTVALSLQAPPSQSSHPQSSARVRGSQRHQGVVNRGSRGRLAAFKHLKGLFYFVI